MIFKDYFGMIMSTIVMLILGLCMSVIGPLCSSVPITLMTVFTGWANAFLINTIAAIVLPVSDWGFAFAVKTCKAEPGSMKFTLLSGVVMAVVYVTIISLGVTLINVGPVPVFFMAWISTYPIMLICGYVISVLATLIAQPIAAKITSGCAK